MKPNSAPLDRPLFPFLSAAKREQAEADLFLEAAVISSRVLKISVLAAAAALVGLVTLEVGTRFPHLRSPESLATLQPDPGPPPLRAGVDGAAESSPAAGTVPVSKTPDDAAKAAAQRDHLPAWSWSAKPRAGALATHRTRCRATGCQPTIP